MPQLTLYRANGACSLVAHILLTEFNIPFDEVLLKFNPQRGYESADGSFTREEYFKIHPSAYVPALKIDDYVLTENTALQTYIQTYAPERHLLGETPMERARVAEWMSYISASVHGDGVAMWGRPGRFSDDEAHHVAIKEKGRKKLLECFAEIDRRIGDGEFAVGRKETLADYYLFYFFFMGQAPFVGFKMGQYKNYARLAKKMFEKEFVKKVMLKEELTLSFE